MKRQHIIILSCAALLLSSCSSYTGNHTAEGVYAGATFGRVIGSAIGGISGGWRGHEWGTLIGTVGGAAVGAAIGSAADRQQADVQASRQHQRRHSDRDQAYDYGYDASGYDAEGRGNDIIQFDDGGTDVPGYQGASVHIGRDAGQRFAAAAQLEVRNACVHEAVSDGVLTRGEECRVMFEIVNNSDYAVYDVTPFVEDATGNRHITISQNLHIESIAPHQGVRYTASVVADNRLRDGEIVLRVGLSQGRRVLSSQTQVLTVPTAKRPSR